MHQTKNELPLRSPCRSKEKKCLSWYRLAQYKTKSTGGCTPQTSAEQFSNKVSAEGHVPETYIHTDENHKLASWNVAENPLIQYFST